MIAKWLLGGPGGLPPSNDESPLSDTEDVLGPRGIGDKVVGIHATFEAAVNDSRPIRVSFSGVAVVTGRHMAKSIARNWVQVGAFPCAAHRKERPMHESKAKYCGREAIRRAGGRQFELSQFAQMYGLTYDHARDILAVAGESRAGRPHAPTCADHTHATEALV